MRIVKPEIQILSGISYGEMLEKLERIGRVCYKSEGNIKEGSAEKFLKNIIARGHESVIEHESISVKVICDRGVSHEIVRHRIASYSQESTRYCNYAKDKFQREMTFIRPFFWESDPEKFAVWKKAMESAEQAYLTLIDLGASPQEARSVLPNSLKTEIVVTMDLREWRHFFRLRTAPAAHPQMREVALPLLEAFRQTVPVVFDQL